MCIRDRSLDRYEGFPTDYVKRKRRVILSDGSEIEGMVYIMRLIRLHPPTAGYYQGSRDAYKRLGFRDDIARVLEPALVRSQMCIRYRYTPSDRFGQPGWRQGRLGFLGIL